MKKHPALVRLQSAAFLLGVVAVVVTWANAQNEKTRTTAATAGKPQLQQKSDANFTTWPAMPARPSDRSKLYGLPVTEPTAAPHPNDPLHEITQNPQFRGILTYAPKVHAPNQGGAYSIFVMRGVGLTKNIAAQPSDVAIYGVNSGSPLFNPRFSPDGRYISYGEGEPGFAMATNDFYVWDLAGKQIHLVNPKLQTAYTDLPWSPDSTHLAFAVNVYASGDPAEPQHLYTPRLHTYNLTTKENHAVVSNPLLTNPLGQQYQRAVPFAWTPQGNLLFTKRPETPPNPTTADAPELPPLPRPNIYAVPPDGGHSTLIISEAFDPLPSPDSQWIAYSGWYTDTAETKADTVNQKPQPEAKTQPIERPGIFLFHKAQKKRILVRALPLAQRRGQIPPIVRVRWTPDSQRLILIEIARTPGPADKSQAEAHISTLNIPPQMEPENADNAAVPTVSQAAIQPVATLQAKEGYDVREVSRDGQFLFVDVSEGAVVGAAPGQGGEAVSTQAVHLSDGTVSLLARFYNNGSGHISGWGWYDLSTPIATAKTNAAKIP